MSICPIDRGQCDCQPDEGVPCSATEDKSVIARLAYEAGEFNERSICEAKYLRAKARIAQIEAELAAADSHVQVLTDALEHGHSMLHPPLHGKECLCSQCNFVRKRAAALAVVKREK